MRSAERQQAGLTLAELHERYQAEAMPRRAKTPTAYKRQIRAGVGKLLPLFGSTALASLTRPELRRFCDSWLLEGREPATLNWVLSGLSAVWRWAQEVGLLSDSLSCPVRGLFQTPKAGSIDYLSAEQVCQLHDSCGGDGTVAASHDCNGGLHRNAQGRAVRTAL